MNFRQIEIFHAVYTNGSVSAAANVLNISQPSVSNILKHTESVIGFPLFDRVKGRLVPTADAHALFGEVAEIQDRVNALRKAGLNLRHGRVGALRVSALPALGMEVLPAAAAEFLSKHGDVSFELEIVHHQDMVRALYERETDIVIGNQVPPHSPVASRPIGEGELVILYREAEMPDAPARLPLSWLEGRPFIGSRPASPFGQLLYNELERAGVEPQEISSARTFYLSAAMVRAGVGVTITDNFTANALAGDGLAFRPIQPPITFGLNVIHLESKPLSMLASAFIELLGRKIEQL